MEEQEVNINYPIARQDHLIQQLPQFRIIKRGARQKGVERFYQTKDKKTSVTIRMFKELDIADQDLLLAILAIALPHTRGNMLSADSTNNIELWNKLKIKGIFAEWETLNITTSYRELLREVNKKIGGSGKKWIEDSLDRLSLTNIKIDTKTYKGASNFVSYGIDKENEKIKIAINPISAVVLLGDKKGYILHNRKERLALKTTPSRALFSILVGLVNIHQSKTLSVPMLLEKMHFIEWKEQNKDQRKNIKRSFAQAIEEINFLEKWKITDNKNNTITIYRD